WEFLSGDLPPGLTLSETGVLSGTPTQTGVYSFSVRAINDLGEDTRLFELNVYALPVITTVSLGYARLGSPYSGQLTAAGSTPMTWAVISGSLPTGLSLNANTGAITGVPLASGRFTFTVAATNIAGNSAPAQFIVDAGLALAIVTTSPLRSATVNVLYGALQFVAEGIDTSATVAWSVGAGTTLPQGMTLSTAGVLSGTPASTGTYNFSITITNGAAVATSPFTLFVGAPPVITSPPVLGGGVDRPFTTVLSASGSTPITWTMTAGPAWTGGPKPPPPTIDITLASNGVLSWLIPTEGNYTFTAVAANEFGNSAPVVFFLDITTPGIKTTAVKNGIVGEAYLEYILASGDQPFTWSLVSGALPPGLTWDTAIVTDPDTATPTMAFRISGTPTSTGEYSFAVRVSNFGGFAEESFTLTVYAKPVITTASLNSGNVNAVYSQTLQATGTTPIAWSILPPAGSETGLPPGLSLSGATISGIPAAEGIYTFTVRAQNSTGSGYANEKQFSIAIGPSGAPVITTGSTLSAIRGTAFSVALAANGNQPISWALEGGSSLPNGITLVDNALSGTPTTAGVYTFVITATNANGVDSRTYIMTIADPPVITTASLEDGATGVAYSQALSATGDAPISWTVVTPLIAGETGLPPGLSLNANTGIISGTPGASGIFSFRIRAVNGAGYDVAPLTIDVIESFFHETILDGEIVGGFFLDGEEIFAIVISGDIVYLSN
ncbi:MAG: putative Ig domain-containing protein, partial [Oscillospiraceae bacterium]|nr:putative Ig domain-containing protein [Oscillospiraceae bacterium]